MANIHERFRAAHDRGDSGYVFQPRILHPLENEEIKILLLENISQDAVASFRSQAYHVDHRSKAMSEDELVENIGAYHAIGIRSKTKITERVLKAASKVNFIQTPIFQRSSVDIFSSSLLSVASVLGPTRSI